MTAISKGTKRARAPGSMEGVLPGETLDAFEKRVGDDVPELTDEFFKNARPISEFPDLARAIVSARTAMRGQRGPQKSPTKERVALRLDRNVVDHFRSAGPGWQTRINDALAELVKRSGR